MEIEIDEEKVDEAVLALLYLTTFKDKPYWRAWKGHNWDSLDRLIRRVTSRIPPQKQNQSF
jgi:hypothetical protein